MGNDDAISLEVLSSSDHQRGDRNARAAQAKRTKPAVPPRRGNSDQAMSHTAGAAPTAGKANTRAA